MMFSFYCFRKYMLLIILINRKKFRSRVQDLNCTTFGLYNHWILAQNLDISQYVLNYLVQKLFIYWKLIFSFFISKKYLVQANFRKKVVHNINLFLISKL